MAILFSRPSFLVAILLLRIYFRRTHSHVPVNPAPGITFLVNPKSYQIVANHFCELSIHPYTFPNNINEL